MGAEAWQAVKNFTDGPESVADYAAQGLGSVAGLYPAMKTAGITAVRAGLGALGARIATGAAVGVPVGVGATKGSQYEESLQYLQGQEFRKRAPRKWQRRPRPTARTMLCSMPLVVVLV